MKKQLIGLAALSLLALAFVFANQQSKSRLQQPSKMELSIKGKVGVPTAIQEGVMTDKQRKHSKIFKGFEASTRGKKLRDVANEIGDVYLVNMVADGKLSTNFNLQQYLNRLTCASSAVVVGTVLSKSSQLIDEGTFTFTDYELTVTEVLKDNVAAPIHLNQTLTYTSPGGSVTLGGKVISAVDYRGEPLQLGKQYLLYLNFVSETGSYKGFSNEVDGDTFEFGDGIVSQASKKPLPLGAKRTTDANGFMAAVRVAVYQACGK